MTAEDFLESNQKLRVQQQVEQEDEEDRADELEAEELNNLRQVSCKTYEFFDWLSTVVYLYFGVVFAELSDWFLKSCAKCANQS